MGPENDGSAMAAIFEKSSWVGRFDVPNALQCAAEDLEEQGFGSSGQLLQQYRTEQEHVLAQMKVDIQRLDRKVEEMCEHLRLGRWALLARGSYARGDFAPYSDVDLLFVQLDSINRRHAQSWHGTSIGDHAVGIQFTSRKPPKRSLGQLASLFTAMEVRYVGGDHFTYLVFKDKLGYMLRNYNVSDMASLFNEDIFRPISREAMGPTSQHYHNIKTGPGGSIDCEFVRLIAHQMRISDQEPSSREAGLLHESDATFRYLAVLKSHLHTRSRGPLESTGALYRLWSKETSGERLPWFLYPSVIDRVRATQARIVRSFLQLASGRDQC